MPESHEKRIQRLEDICFDLARGSSKRDEQVKTLFNHVGTIQKSVNNLEDKLDAKSDEIMRELREIKKNSKGKMTAKEKVAIIVAVVTAIGSAVVALIANWTW